MTPALQAPFQNPSTSKPLLGAYSPTSGLAAAPPSHVLPRPHRQLLMDSALPSSSPAAVAPPHQAPQSNHRGSLPHPPVGGKALQPSDSRASLLTSMPTAVSPATIEGHTQPTQGAYSSGDQRGAAEPPGHLHKATIPGLGNKTDLLNTEK